MNNNLKNKLNVGLLLIFLSVGLMVCSIGITLCRYEVQDFLSISYKVKSFASLFIESDRHEWFLNEDKSILELAFSISNVNPENNEFPSTDHVYYVRLVSDLDTTLTLRTHSTSGRLVTCEATKTFDEEKNIYLYRFYDEKGEEISFASKGNQPSTTDFKLQTPYQKKAFLSELIIMDASYEVEASKNDMVSHYDEEVMTSNYLSEHENLKVLFEDSIDLSFISSIDVKCKVIASTNNDNIQIKLTDKTSTNIEQTETQELETEDPITNELEGEDPTTNEMETQEPKPIELEINAEANKEKMITLSVEPFESETDVVIDVEWQILNASDEIEKVFKGSFIIPSEVEPSTKPESVTLEYVAENKKEFSINKPLEFNVISLVDTTVQVNQTTFPKNTRYSLDAGNSWYVLTKDSNIQINLKANQKQHVMIELNNDSWTEQFYEVGIYHLDEQLSTLDFTMKVEEKENLEILKSYSGIINEHPLTFTLNQENVTFSFEHLEDEKYKVIEDTQFFEVTKQNNGQFSLKIKIDIKVPDGAYQLKIRNTKNEEVTFTFFVKNPEETEVEA